MITIGAATRQSHSANGQDWEPFTPGACIELGAHRGRTTYGRLEGKPADKDTMGRCSDHFTHNVNYLACPQSLTSARDACRPPGYSSGKISPSSRPLKIIPADKGISAGRVCRLALCIERR